MVYFLIFPIKLTEKTIIKHIFDYDNHFQIKQYQRPELVLRYQRLGLVLSDECEILIYFYKTTKNFEFQLISSNKKDIIGYATNSPSATNFKDELNKAFRKIIKIHDKTA